MWRLLILVVLFVCLAGLVGCGGGSGLNLSGTHSPGTVPDDTGTSITPPTPEPPPVEPPAPPVFP